MVSPFVDRATACGVPGPSQVYNSGNEIEFILCGVAARKLCQVGWSKVRDVWNGDAVDQTTAVFNPHTTFRYQFQGRRVDPVFDFEHSPGKRFLGIGWPHRNRALRDDRSG